MDRGVAPLRLRRGPVEVGLPRPAQVLRAVVLAVAAGLPVDGMRTAAMPRGCAVRAACCCVVARVRVLSIGRLPGQRQPARRHGVGQVFAQLLGLGGAPVGGDAHRLQGNYLLLFQAPLPEPSGPGAVEGQRAALVEEAVVERRGILLRLRQQKE